MMRTGRCQCGGVAYSCAAEPIELYVCHCTNCRAQSSSAFGISFIVPGSSFRVTAGAPSFYEWHTDCGGRSKGAFCPSCGSRLWHQDSGNAEFFSVKGGSLDEPPDISTAFHIWVSSKLPGVLIPSDAKQFLQEPD